MIKLCQIFLLFACLLPTAFANISIPEATYSSDRFDFLIDEASSLLKDGEYTNAKEKLDEYINQVLFPRDCGVIDLYIEVFQKKGEQDAVSEYAKYGEICRGEVEEIDIKRFSNTISNDALYIDENIFLWKAYLKAEYQNELVELEELQGLNSIFIELVYAAKTRDQKLHPIPFEYEKVILESDHALKPSIIMLYIGNIRLSDKDYDIFNLVMELFSYEDIYLRNFISYNSSYEFAFKYLGNAEEDYEKKLLYRINALKYSTIHDRNDKKGYEDVVLMRERDLVSTIFEGLEKNNADIILSHLGDIQELSQVNWGEFTTLYQNKEYNFNNTEKLLSFYSKSSDYFNSDNKKSISILKKYLDGLAVGDKTDCNAIQELLNLKNIDYKIQCSEEASGLSSDENIDGIDSKDMFEDLEENNDMSSNLSENKYIILLLSIIVLLLILVAGFIIFKRR